MSKESRFELVKRKNGRIVTEEGLNKVLEKEKATAYYGMAPTGPVHIGYFAKLSKIFDLMNAGIKTKILIADIHATLDDLKTPWNEIDKRAASEVTGMKEPKVSELIYQIMQTLDVHYLNVTYSWVDWIKAYHGIESY